jgi:hypothetical protein
VVVKQVKRDMTDSVYSLVDFPIVQEEEDQHYCRETDQRKGPYLATVERGSTATLGKVVIPLAWVRDYRMGSEGGKWVVGLVGAFDLDMIGMEVDVTPNMDLGDQASLGCTSPPGSLCRVQVVSIVASCRYLTRLLTS